MSIQNLPVVNAWLASCKNAHHNHLFCVVISDYQYFTVFIQGLTLQNHHSIIYYFLSFTKLWTTLAKSNLNLWTNPRTGIYHGNEFFLCSYISIYEMLDAFPDDLTAYSSPTPLTPGPPLPIPLPPIHSISHSNPPPSSLFPTLTPGLPLYSHPYPRPSSLFPPSNPLYSPPFLTPAHPLYSPPHPRYFYPPLTLAPPLYSSPSNPLYSPPL